MNSSYSFNLIHTPNTDHIIMQVAGKMAENDFKDNTLKMLSLLKAKKVNKVLADCSKMKIISLNDRNWLENEFLPLATEEGFKAVCFVKPEDYYARLSIELVMYKFPETKLQGAWFNEVSDAKTWLSSIAV